MEKVESWVYQIENYLMLANLQNENLKLGILHCCLQKGLQFSCKLEATICKPLLGNS